jgi:hypothetical protein
LLKVTVPIARCLHQTGQYLEQQSAALESAGLGELQLGALITDPDPNREWGIRNIISWKMVGGEVQYSVDVRI